MGQGSNVKTAEHFAVIIDRKSGVCRRIFNPDFDYQFAGHHVGPDEFMLRIRKDDFGVSKKPNGMTLEQAQRILRAFGWPI